MATVNGTNFADELAGTADGDVISGFSGDDDLLGQEGNDKIYGGDGDDDIDGYDGSDKLFGGQDNDLIHSGAGNDIVRGDEGNDILDGEGGRDVIYGGLGYDEIYGGDDDDQLHGGESYDYLSGGSGNDQLFGDSNSDTLDGGVGDDLLDGGNTDDPTGPDFSLDLDGIAFGSANTGVVVNLESGIAKDGRGGNDTLVDIESVIGTKFEDNLIGGNANNNDFEQFTGGAGDDTIDGGAGFDMANYGTAPTFEGQVPIIADLAAGTIRDDFGSTDVVVNIECISATSFADRLFGSDQAEEFRPLEGNDSINGRGGVDTVSYTTSRSPIVRGIEADLRIGMVIDTGGFADQLTSIENVTGGRADDTIRGNKLDNVLDGFLGDDLLKGGGGLDNLLGGKGNDYLDGGGVNDRLDGGEGNDTLRGGAGADTFVFGEDSDEDHILDFVTGADKLDVSALGFASAADVMAKFKVLSPGAAMIDLGNDSYVIFDYVNTANPVLALGDIIV